MIYLAFVLILGTSSALNNANDWQGIQAPGVEAAEETEEQAEAICAALDVPESEMSECVFHRIAP